MQIISFRITNFRSIVDTGWVNLSPDSLTALVGQNESGKTAVLSALAATFSSDRVHTDDVRQDSPPPEIWVKTKFTKSEIETAGAGVASSHARAALVAALKDDDGMVTWHFPSEIKGEPDLSMSVLIHSPDVHAIVDEVRERLRKTTLQQDDEHETPSVAAQAAGTATTANAPGSSASSATSPSSLAAAPGSAQAGAAPSAFAGEVEDPTAEAAEQLRQALFDIAPTVTMFSEDSGLLPNKIDISDDFKLAKTLGANAVRNFLSVAQIDLKKLVQNTDTRVRTGMLNAANKKISAEFLSFWSQTIGKSSKIQIKCSINNHPAAPAGVADKAGKPYLEFLIEDGGAPLYPQQRSRGTRWFISFFLQMKASELDAHNSFFLLDEPGANLHEKAQADVLKLLEKIKDSVGVVYSTHSPHLLDQKSLYRVIAVERDPDADGYPTKIIGAHALGAASTDTLSPIYTLMGANLSHQTAIKKKNNVILEELSAQYYLRAFWNLMGCNQDVNYLSATGVSNVEMLANLFLGWGLDFIVVVDDEPSGRTVFNTLKRDMFLGQDDWAQARMYKIKDCDGIEDLFCPFDYKKLILKDENLNIEKSNSQWAKKHGAAKAMHALQFMLDVESGKVGLADLSEKSRSNISKIVDEIVSRLKNYDKH